MRLPFPRGPLSGLVRCWLAGDGEPDADAARALLASVPADVDPVTDDDVQLALWMMYELHYRGFEEVEDRWEWDPRLLEVRALVETLFEQGLRELSAETVRETLAADGSLAERLFALTDGFDAPPLSRFVQRQASQEQVLELLRQRSVYTLKEADPHTFVIPRLEGGPKVAMAEVQYDEYGSGRPQRQHARMFGDTLEACGLSRTYGAYVDSLSGAGLAVNNAMSLFGLHRRLRGATVGHFAAVESTSAAPSRRYASALERLGFPPVASAYYHEHVEADSAHEQLALRDVCEGLVAAEPTLEADVVFGAAVCLHLDALAAAQLLDTWTHAEPVVSVGGG